jgi:hypothetical protein
VVEWRVGQLFGNRGCGEQVDIENFFGYLSVVGDIGD